MSGISNLFGMSLAVISERLEPGHMSVVKARRGKGRNMRLPVSPEGRLLVRRPTTPIKLYSQQSCYVCDGVMPVGTTAVFSRNKRRWRHTTCSNPQD